MPSSGAATNPLGKKNSNQVLEDIKSIQEHSLYFQWVFLVPQICSSVSETAASKSTSKEYP